MAPRPQKRAIEAVQSLAGAYEAAQGRVELLLNELERTVEVLEFGAKKLRWVKGEDPEIFLEEADTRIWHVRRLLTSLRDKPPKSTA